MIGPGTLERLRGASPYNVVRLILPAYVPGGTPAAAAPADAAEAGARTADEVEAGRPADGAEAGARTAGEAESGRRTADRPATDGPAAQGVELTDGMRVAPERVAAARAEGEIAAARLRDWLADGALAVDDKPALYVYEQRGSGRVQRGLIGLVAVGTDAVHAHEGVMPGPVAGRRELMKATRSNLEPILLVYNGGTGAGGHGGAALPAGTGAASRLVDRTADSQEPLACAVTDDGVTHRLWAVTDPAAQAAVAADLATRTALIADGHHRYAAYRELRSELRASGAGDGPWDYGLAFLVDSDEYPLELGPIHRVLPRLAPADAARLAAGAFTVTEVDGGTALDQLARAGKSGPAFLLAGQGKFWLLTDPDPRQLAAAMPPGTSPRWQALDAAVMRELLLRGLWSIQDNERDVLISHDAAEAIRMAADAGGTAVICNPMPLTAVMDIAAHGEKVPRKSTSFGPKPLTGLVLRTFDD